MFRQVSSINTSLVLSQRLCWLLHRCRPSRTSGRSCSAARSVFFIVQPQRFQAMPERCGTNLDLQSLPDELPQLRQSRVIVLLNPSLELSLMTFQPRSQITAHLLGRNRTLLLLQLEESLDTPLAYPEQFRHLHCRMSCFPGLYHSTPQIIVQWSHPSSIARKLKRDYLNRKCSKVRGLRFRTLLYNPLVEIRIDPGGPRPEIDGTDTESVKPRLIA